MSVPTYELATGAVDNVNALFSTSVPYTAGTLAVFLNGQLLLNSGGNPWAETSPVLGTFTLAGDCIPQTGDQVAVFFLDTTDDPLYQEITPLYGSLAGPIQMSGALDAIELSGNAETRAAMSGECAIIEMAGTLEPIGTIDAVMEC